MAPLYLSYHNIDAISEMWLMQSRQYDFVVAKYLHVICVGESDGSHVIHQPARLKMTPSICGLTAISKASLVRSNIAI